MKNPQIHNLINLFYTQDEAAQQLGITRGTYNRAITYHDTPAYHSYMRRLTQALLKDIESEIHDNPRHTGHYAALAAAIRSAVSGSYSINMGVAPHIDSDTVGEADRHPQHKVQAGKRKGVLD